MAEWAGVNVNTVRGVYVDLEDEGLVETRHGRGTFVAESVEPLPELETIAGEALARTREAGLDPGELAVVAMACAGIPFADIGIAPEPAEMPDAEQGSEMLEVRQELGRQIGRLEAELGAYVRDLPAESVESARRPEPRLIGIEELEGTRDRLIERLSDAQRAAAQRARREAEARSKREAILEGPGPAPGDPDSRGHAAGQPATPLGDAMGWWRLRASGGVL